MIDNIRINQPVSLLLYQNRIKKTSVFSANFIAENTYFLKFCLHILFYIVKFLMNEAERNNLIGQNSTSLIPYHIPFFIATRVPTKPRCWPCFTGGKAMTKIKFLIVGNMTLSTRGIQQLLEREPDLEVVGALSSLAELEKEIAEHQPDIIVIDAPIKKENDLIWTKDITSRSPASKVVILSGYDNAEYIHAAHAVGAYAFVSKQDSAETLIHAIRESHRRAKSFPAYLDSYDYLPLTEIELAVLDLIAKDKTNSEIGEQLNISKQTVEHHVSSILRKQYVKSRSGAGGKAFMLGLLQ
jgi:DNA-binding NarL/FixJ family response regulator